MPVWIDFWQERAEKAEYVLCRMAALLQDCDGCSDEMIRRYARGRVRGRGYLASGEWSELAGIVEADLDLIAETLTFHERHHWPKCNAAELHWVDTMYHKSRDERYRPLPAGPTLQGNLASGGITEF